MKKIINPCKCLVYTSSGTEVLRNAFCKIEYNESEGRLSITGVIAPTRNGNALGSAGQCVDEIRGGTPTDDWNKEMLNKFCDIWDRWHLNDLRPYCNHQKELGWNIIASKKVNISTHETKSLGWLRPDEHPEGILTKPCPVCGYKYGTAWLKEEVPEDVIKWLSDLPETKITPAWV